MRIIARRKLREFWAKHPDAEQPLKAWYEAVKGAIWDTPHDLKATFPKARLIGDGRAIFNIVNNRFRLIVRVNFQYHQVYVRFIGTHQEYDLIDPKEV